ncbi:MAG TPA: alanine--glyoxylate aminotransferase family protein [Chloroflexia bacterium]|jgi:aspartate aminotransferase-like enzyme
MQLRIPGPTPLPDEVIDAMHRDMISHRGDEFHDMLRDVTTMLKRGFQTEGDVLIFPGAGTGGLEASIANLFSAGDTVISLSVGSFGDRYAEIAERFGLHVVRVASPWGETVDLDALQAALVETSNVKGVLVTHNETSTGVQNDVEAVSRIVRHTSGAHGNSPLLLVDCISSLGAADIPVDRWGIDVAITASQKAWMAPPGLTMLSVSDRAWEAHAQAKLPHFYWDFSEAKKYLAKWETPYTPAVSLLYALQASLALIMQEGLPNVFARHERLRDRVRTAARRMHLDLLAPDDIASRTVTAIKVPPGLTASSILAAMRDRGVIIAGGQDAYKEQLIRIGHMGFITEQDIDEVMLALEEVAGVLVG